MLKENRNIPCKICAKLINYKYLTHHSLNCKLKVEYEKKITDLNKRLKEILSDITKEKRKLNIEITLEKNILTKIKSAKAKSSISEMISSKHNKFEKYLENITKIDEKFDNNMKQIDEDKEDDEVKPDRRPSFRQNSLKLHGIIPLQFN